MQSTNISPSISYSAEQYLDIIKIIYEKHVSHNGKWLSNQLGTSLYNLKKTEVRTIMPDQGKIEIQNDFYNYIINYKNELTTLYADIINGLNQSLTPYIKGRIKNDDSIINKLHKKRNEQNGAFPINKVLNDLLGFRIIDPKFGENITNVIEILSSLNTDGYRFQHKRRENGDYEAYHIYFMGKDAKYFPIELQIWDTKNERTNLASHEIYKKDYTSWPEIYKKG